MNESLSLAMFGLPGGTEWIIIGLVALLLFGRRLPEVARSLGKSIVEFKRGIRDVKEDIDTDAENSAASKQLDARPKRTLEHKPDDRSST